MKQVAACSHEQLSIALDGRRAAVVARLCCRGGDKTTAIYRDRGAEPTLESGNDFRTGLLYEMFFYITIID